MGVVTPITRDTTTGNQRNTQAGEFVDVAFGGTGAGNAPAARTNLGAAANGANSDITSLTGLTTALSVAQGGTGNTTGDASALSVTAAGGTAARTHADRAADKVSVKDFGATGDGITDDGPAFKKALSSNRHVLIPAGVYLIGTTVGASALSDLIIELLAGATVKQAPTLASKCLQFNNCTRVRLTGSGRASLIDVSAAPNSQAGQANDAIYFSGGSNCEVDHLRLYAGASYVTAGGDSGVFGACDAVKIHHNIFEGFSDEGVYISGLGNGDTTNGRGEVYSNTFINCANAGGTKRLYQSVSWHDNVIIGGQNGFFSGEADTSNLPGVRNLFLNNRFEGLTGTAITSRISQLDQISGNTGYNLQGNFISLEGTSGALVKNNRLFIDPAVYVSPSTQYGVVVQARTFNGMTYNSSGNIVQDNTFSGVYTPMRELDANQTSNAFLNNVYAGNTSTPSVLSARSYISDQQIRRLQGLATGFTGAEKVEAQASLKSTNGNTSNVYTITIGNSRSTRVEVSAVANGLGANAFGQSARATFRRPNGGAVTQVGTTEFGAPQNDFGATPGINIIADTASNVIRVQITGVAATTMYWVLNITYTIVAIDT